VPNFLSAPLIAPSSTDTLASGSRCRPIAPALPPVPSLPAAATTRSGNRGDASEGGNQAATFMLTSQ